MVVLGGKLCTSQSVKHLIVEPFSIASFSVLQGIHDSVDIHRQSFHCRRISGRLRVHSRGAVSSKSGHFKAITGKWEPI